MRHQFRTYHPPIIIGHVSIKRDYTGNTAPYSSISKKREREREEEEKDGKGKNIFKRYTIDLYILRHDIDTFN